MTRYPKKGRGHKWTVRELESIPTTWAKDSIADGEGLTGQVRVVNGTAAVAFRYSFKWDGRKVWYYCGNWPTVDLMTIRERRDNARALVAQGVDPRRQKVADKIEAQRKVEQVISEERERRAHDLSVKDLYDAWISEGVRRSDENAELKRIFGKDVLPTVGDSALRALSEDDIKRILRPVIARGANRLAVIIFGAIGQMLGWAEDRQPWRRLLIEGNPAKLIDLDLLLDDDYDPENVRTRVLHDTEIIELAERFRSGEEEYEQAPNKRVAKLPVAPATQHAVWICLSTLTRIGALTKAEKVHINLPERTWFIPKENSKGRRRQKQDQLVYLSDFAARHFEAAMELSDSLYVFPARDGRGPLSGQSVTKQIGDRQTQFKAEDRTPLKGRRNDNTLVLAEGANGNWTPHDLRRTGATIMQRLGASENVIDRCQGHVVHTGKNKIRRHYQLYEFADEKRQAWQDLGQYLDQLLPSGLTIPRTRRSKASKKGPPSNK
ncbi:tyrosine-type recombinase/integrase [Achromobacter spanius]|uniref:tyrosine-type recombinase/integrase n=1 Tax=Achromobacter spanius TaxID=217203 RepID=UPI0037F14AC4